MSSTDNTGTNTQEHRGQRFAARSPVTHSPWSPPQAVRPAAPPPPEGSLLSPKNVTMGGSPPLRKPKPKQHEIKTEECNQVVVTDIISGGVSTQEAPRPGWSPTHPESAAIELSQPNDAVTAAFSPEEEHTDIRLQVDQPGALAAPITNTPPGDEISPQTPTRQTKNDTWSPGTVARAAESTPNRAKHGGDLSSPAIHPFNPKNFMGEHKRSFYQRYKGGIWGVGCLIFLGFIAILVWQLFLKGDSEETESLLQCVMRLFTNSIDDATTASVADCVDEAGECITDTVNACVKTVTDRNCILDLVPSTDLGNLTANYQRSESAVADVLALCVNNATSLQNCTLAATAIGACNFQLQSQTEFFFPSNSIAQQFFDASAPTPTPPLPESIPSPSVTRTPTSTASNTISPSPSATATMSEILASLSASMTASATASPSATASVTASLSMTPSASMLLRLFFFDEPPATIDLDYVDPDDYEFLGDNNEVPIDSSAPAEYKATLIIKLLGNLFNSVVTANMPVDQGLRLIPGTANEYFFEAHPDEFPDIVNNIPAYIPKPESGDRSCGTLFLQMSGSEAYTATTSVEICGNP